MRYRRKAVEVQVDRCDLDHHVDGRIVDPDTFEREYEPVPEEGDGHMIDFGAKRIDCPNEAPLALADKLAEALRDLMIWGVEMDDERLGYIAVQVDRCSVLGAAEALSAYLESRKEAR